jgi:hypothetical protein
MAGSNQINMDGPHPRQLTLTDDWKVDLPV